MKLLKKDNEYDLLSVVALLVSKFPYRHTKQNVINEYYFNSRKLNLAEIGLKCDCTRERARQIISVFEESFKNMIQLVERETKGKGN